jgi:hypothetical protein
MPITTTIIEVYARMPRRCPWPYLRAQVRVDGRVVWESRPYPARGATHRSARQRTLAEAAAWAAEQATAA